VESLEISRRARPKSVTIRDVAQVAGVGKTTVSFVLNGKGNISAATRETVLQAMQTLGFEANPNARRLASGYCSKTVGIYSLNLDLNTGSHKVHLIQRSLHDLGYSAPLYAYTDSGGNRGENQQLPLMRTLCLQRPRAIICNTTNIHSDALEELRHYHEEGGFVVSYDHDIDLDCDRVVFDREHNSYLAARHLVELGHQKIGYFAGGPHKPSGQRIEGLKRALNEAGLTLREDWLFHGGDFLEYEEQGALLAAQFLKLNPADRPTGMCVVNDYTATTFIAEVERGGLRVPQNISVVGHDDRPLARYGALPLTTVTHPIPLIVQNVVTMLRNRLESQSNDAPQRVTVQGELVIRQSTARLTRNVQGARKKDK
jgi:LacI family transcriptional regulator